MPILPEDITQIEKQKAMNSLIFLTEKKDGTIKARACANGSSQRKFIMKEEAASPTVTTEGLLTTCIIDAKQNRDIVTLDKPNAFVQTPLLTSKEQIIMTMDGKLVDLLDEIAPQRYSKFIQEENGSKKIYVVMERALYSMMMSSLLFYRHFRKDLESIGFRVNPYDMCIANRKIEGHQQTVTWHVNNIKVSHINPKVNENFCKWCEEKYGDDKNGKVKIHKGKVHNYLAMRLDYSTPNKVKIDMRDYCKQVIEEYPYTINNKVNCPWNANLFSHDKDHKKLHKNASEIFHTYVMKCLFAAKWGRPDILTGISYLSTKVLNPYNEDIKKLTRIISYLKNSINICLTLEADDIREIKWYVNSSFGTH